MPYFDRFDICEAYLALEWDYNQGGILRERPSNARRNMSTDYQLRTRMQFRPSMLFSGFHSLSENGKEIYHQQVLKLKLSIPDCCDCFGVHADDCDHRCEESYCSNFEATLNDID